MNKTIILTVSIILATSLVLTTASSPNISAQLNQTYQNVSETAGIDNQTAQQGNMSGITENMTSNTVNQTLP